MNDRRPTSARRPRRRLTLVTGVAALAAATGSLATAPASASDPTSRPPSSSASTSASSAPSGTTVDRAPDRRLLEDQLDRVVTEGEAVGALAEARAGRHWWRDAAGLARQTPVRAARPWMQFRAASVTKTAVAVLALQMVEEGRWTLDTTIGDVLPRLWPERSEVTVRQLLSHTSGMPEMLQYYLAPATTPDQLVAAVSRPRTDRELVRAAQALPWLFEPGTGWAYSNTGYVVVGLMLEAETRRPMAHLLRTRVLWPAGMLRSRLARTPFVLGPWLQEYAVYRGEQLDLRSFHPSLFSSAGALLTTTGDLNRFHRALSAGRLLPKELVRTMRTPVHSDPASGMEYGLGTYRLPDPCTPGGFVHGHDGASLGTVTLSFGSADGTRQVTATATGRSLDDPTKPLVALVELTGAALVETCAQPPAASRRTVPQIPTPSVPSTVPTGAR